MFSWIKSLFGDRFRSRVTESGTLERSRAQTVPLSDTQLESVPHRSIRLEPDQLTWCSGISIGRQREYNEDSLFYASALLASEHQTLTFGVFIVADGLGGHEQGDIASQSAIRAMGSHLMKRYYPAFFGLEPQAPEESVSEILEAGIEAAHKAVQRQAPGGGTTLTAVLVLGNRMTIAHVGDSRAYNVHPDGKMELLTRDHSFAQKLVELGELTPEQAETHPRRHDLYRALGLEVSSEPDLFTATRPDAGYLLVCSDGLWGVVPENEISRLILDNPDLIQACTSLVEAANAAGGPDNISVILVQFPKT